MPEVDTGNLLPLLCTLHIEAKSLTNPELSISIGLASQLIPQVFFPLPLVGWSWAIKPSQLILTFAKHLRYQWSHLPALALICLIVTVASVPALSATLVTHTPFLAKQHTSHGWFLSYHVCAGN